MKGKTNNSKKVRKRFIIESIAVFFIIATPFIHKIHDYLPRDPDETFNFLGMLIDRNGFTNLRAYGWFLLQKVIPFYLLLIWFFTNKHWWYHILLIPLCMYAFQIFEVLYSEDTIVDTENIFWLLPICMVVIPFVYFVRVKLYDKHVHGIDLEAMDAELKYYRDKERQANHFVKEKPSAEPQKEEEVEDELSDELPRSMLQKMFSNLKHSMQNLLDMLL
ncbi:hypothetical protein LVD13_03755 [Flavobacteriaceae bacterium D16]|nr:hypothetical protein [Flavobacteriaceae bacterium D16]